MKKKMAVEVEVPEGIKVLLDGDSVVVSGKNGEVRKKMFDPAIKIAVAGNKVTISSDASTKRERRKIGTFRAHIRNMFKGAEEMHVYKLKICSAHFPMTVTADKGIFSIKNFLGEKVPRTIKLDGNVKVDVNGDVIEVSSNDKETAS